jgi:hypothetical protein
LKFFVAWLDINIHRSDPSRLNACKNSLFLIVAQGFGGNKANMVERSLVGEC